MRVARHSVRFPGRGDDNGVAAEAAAAAKDDWLWINYHNRINIHKTNNHPKSPWRGAGKGYYMQTQRRYSP